MTELSIAARGFLVYNINSMFLDTTITVNGQLFFGLSALVTAVTGLIGLVLYRIDSRTNQIHREVRTMNTRTLGQQIEDTTTDNIQEKLREGGKLSDKEESHMRTVDEQAYRIKTPALHEKRDRSR